MKNMAHKETPAHPPAREPDFFKTKSSSRYNNNNNHGSSTAVPNNMKEPSASQYKSLVLTMYNSTKPQTLPELEEILSRHTGDCPVYLKIIFPDQWETILSTDRQVSPSKEMISAIEKILGERSAVLN